MRGLVLSAVVTALSSLCLGPAHSQEFTPVELADMVKSAFSGCMRSQLQNPNNAGASRELIQKYCACTANKIAARTTRSDVQNYEDAAGLANEQMIAKSHKIGVECRAELAK